MNDLSIGVTLEKKGEEHNPLFNPNAVIELFNTLPGRQCIKVDTTPFEKDACFFSSGIDEYKGDNPEEAINNDGYVYDYRNYTGKMIELVLESILKVPVGNMKYGDSKNEDHHDLIFDGVKLGAKGGSLYKKYDGSYSASCTVPLIHIHENLPQIIGLVNRKLHRAYILGIMFPKDFSKNLSRALVKKLSIIKKFKYGVSTFSTSIIIPFNNADGLREVLKAVR